MPDTPRYAGPLPLAEALTQFALVTMADAKFERDRPDANFEHRDLGLAASTGGRIAARHTRAVRPFKESGGWHWHDLTAHVNFVIKGSITFRYAGHPTEVKVEAGACLSQPAGVA